jgi:hypothetical protein
VQGQKNTRGRGEEWVKIEKSISQTVLGLLAAAYNMEIQGWMILSARPWETEKIF